MGATPAAVVPDPGLTAHLTRCLPGPPIGGPLLAVRSITSTQEGVRELAGRGATEGTVVVAEHQTAGRGRRDHAWIAPPGAGLLFSVLLRPTLPRARWPQIGLAAACAVAEGLDTAARVTARLRWPNDVLVDGRKVAGILAEAVADATGAVVLGVGINLEGEPGEWAPDLAGRAASLASLGHATEPGAVLASVLRCLGARYRELQDAGFEPIRRAWRARGVLGTVVRGPAGTGVAVDLGPEGGLVVAGDDGRQRTIVAGEVVAVDPTGGRPGIRATSARRP
jgi:BirA family biotin operon repressor/biotin-[acetyl-CoA-carboxylase] ligase